MENKEKSHSFPGFVLKMAALAATGYAAVKVVKTYFAKDTDKHPLEEGEKRFCLNFDAKKFKGNSKDEVKKITIDSNFSAMELNLTQMDLKEDIRIDCNLFMSAVSIRIPENIEVFVDDKTKMSAVSNSVPSYFKEEYPTVSIVLHGSFCAVSIQCKAVSEEIQ